MKRKFTRFRSYTVRIDGKIIDIHLARQVYRCRECLGPLVYRDSGLACAADTGHAGFIHLDEVEREMERRALELAQVEAVYQIKDGKIVLKEE